ncbi:MAG: UDP-glucose 4-epimerase GalE [Saprospiraceae bacterium]|nr:UDP-glucose 4-epimerase GalE [Saprospiraceae bacterium]
MKEKVLVTGGTGYIGSHTIIYLIETGYDVICVDNGINSDKSVLNVVEKITGVRVPYFHIDLCDLERTESIFKEHSEIHGIIHFAALKSVSDSVSNPIIYFRNNLVSLINILELSVKYNVGAFIFSSSCTVYGDVTHSPVDEDTPLKETASPYGRTKQIGEQIVSDVLKQSNTKSILLRYFNPAGAHPSGLLGESPINSPQNLVPVITETAIGRRQKMIVYGTDYPTRDGSCIRDYIHVCDLARAHTKALNYIFEGKQDKPGDIFNIGIGNGLSVLEIIRAFEKVSGLKLNYEKGERRPGDIMAIFSDYKKAKEQLDWFPEYNVDDIMNTAWIWEQNRSSQIL